MIFKISGRYEFGWFESIPVCLQKNRTLIWSELIPKWNLLFNKIYRFQSSNCLFTSTNSTTHSIRCLRDINKVNSKLYSPFCGNSEKFFKMFMNFDTIRISVGKALKWASTPFCVMSSKLCRLHNIVASNGLELWIIKYLQHDTPLPIINNCMECT